MNGISLVEDNGGVCVRIPLNLKKHGGRKEIHAPSSLDEAVELNGCDNAFAVALAKAYAWKDMLDTGKYRSIRELARELDRCPTYMTRILRYTLLAPDIIQAILDGDEPDGFSQGKLIGAIPAIWSEQRDNWGFKCDVPEESKLWCAF